MPSSDSDDVFDLSRNSGGRRRAPISLQAAINGGGLSGEDSGSMDDEVTAAPAGGRRRGPVPKAKNLGKAEKERREKKKAVAAKKKAERSVFKDYSDSGSSSGSGGSFINDSDGDEDEDDDDEGLLVSRKRRLSGRKGGSGKRRRKGRGDETVDLDGSDGVECVDDEDGVMDLDALPDDAFAGAPRRGKKKTRADGNKDGKEKRRKRVELSDESDYEPLPETKEEKKRRLKLEAAQNVMGSFEEDDAEIAAEGRAEEERRHAADETKRQAERQARRAASARPASAARGRGKPGEIELRFYTDGDPKTLTVQMKAEQVLGFKKLVKALCKRFGVQDDLLLVLWENRVLPRNEPLSTLGLASGLSLEVRQSSTALVGLRVRNGDGGAMLLEKAFIGLNDRILGIRYAVAQKLGLKDENAVTLILDGEEITEDDTPAGLDIDADDVAPLLDAKVTGR